LSVVQHSIRQASNEIDRRRDKDRSSAACSVTSELVGIGCVALTHQLPQPFFIDSRCDFRRQADVAHPAEPIEQFADVVRLRCNGHRLEPSERCRVHRCVKHKQPVEFGNLLVGNRREQSVRRTPAGASSTGYCRPFDALLAGRMTAAARSAETTAAAMGCPRSVLQAA
jgi:hypothetical protein